jgi:hypothetical protein
LDFFVILALLFSNAVVAFWEEHQAGNEIEALKAKLANDATVPRDGHADTEQADAGRSVHGEQHPSRPGNPVGRARVAR